MRHLGNTQVMIWDQDQPGKGENNQAGEDHYCSFDEGDSFCPGVSDANSVEDNKKIHLNK